MHFLNYAYGNNGYNKKVKELMKFCGFDRKVKTYNETLRTNAYLPLYEAGLHRQGSAAVHRYTMMEPADRFALMNVAFGQEDFRVDENLEILG